MDTKRTLYEIEIVLSKNDIFNYVKNIVAFNVNGLWTGKEYETDFNYRKLFLEE